jgi:enterochelin esterase family protein
MHENVTVHEFPSELLAGNPLGDPAVRRVPVYLPPGYDEAAGDDGFPVLYALAAFMSTGLSALNHDWYAESLPERLERLIRTGAMPPVIVVMVDGMTMLGGNQYIDSSAVGPWARHITEELVPWAESTFHIRPGRQHRGVFGHSSGGYGALMMGLEHADVFSAIASSAADCYFEYGYATDFPRAVLGLQQVGGLATFLQRLRRRDWPKFPGALIPALGAVAMAHFYSPDPAAPHGFRLPFDEATGERDEAVFARWLERDPVRLARTKAEQLRSLSHIWFEVGRRDEYHHQHGARILRGRLQDAGIQHHYEEYDDGHRSTRYRFDTLLPPLAQAVSGTDVPG